MDSQDRMVSRRKFVGSLAGLGAGAALACNSGGRQEQAPEFTGPLTGEKLSGEIEVSKPNGLNLIVIISDTFRWDYLHFNGNRRIQTPHLDALAEEGVYFANCYADGLPTIPARRVIHTGRSILPEREKWHPLAEGDVTFAEVLAKAGFTSGFVVDTYHHFKPGMNFHRGFNSWTWVRGQESDPYVSGPHGSVNPADYTPEHLLNDNFGKRITQYVLNTGGRKSQDDYFCARSTLEAARWLEENKDNDGPFMLFIDMFDPHEPWDAPPEFQKIYRREYPLERYIFGYGVDHQDVLEEDIPLLIDLYSAEVTFMDYCIGRLIERVKRLGLWENTVIAFSTDHGTHLGEQGCIQKQPKLLNSCVARVPLIIRHPDPAFKGKRIDGLTSHLDFMPTFLNLLGVEGYTGMDGLNMWDLVAGLKTELRPQAVTGFKDFGSVHSLKWHYFRNIWEEDPGLGPALYDLEKDPGEQQNVAADHPQVVGEMKSILEREFKVSLA
ncbi:MAG: sulfatase [Candidatus Glassbacteria bacterium]|nr:sulfatase [Candidatus Glassbacteria bacterium]